MKKEEILFKLSKKDDLQYMSPMKASLLLLNSKLSSKTDFKLLRKYYFLDYSLMHFFIFENYIS